MASPSRGSSVHGQARTRSVRASDVLWRLGTSPWTFLCAGLLLSGWLLMAAFVPQAPAEETALRVGGGAWQLARLFDLHTVGSSWVLWLLLTVLALSASGLALTRPKNGFRWWPLASVLAGTLAVAISALGVERGRIEIVEGATDSASTHVVRHLARGVQAVQLPFDLTCEAEGPAGVPCEATWPGNRRLPFTLAPAGEGSVAVDGVRFARIGEEEISGKAAWFRLGSSGSAPRLQPGEIVELASGADGDSLQVAAFSTPLGPIFLASSRHAWLGLSAHQTRGFPKAAAADPPMGLGRAIGPRRFQLAYRGGVPQALPIALAIAAWLSALLALRGSRRSSSPDTAREEPAEEGR